MAIEEIGLGHGLLRSLGAGRKIGVVYLREGDEGGPPEVVVFVDDGREHDITLRPGDTFPVGDETWKLDRVEDPDSRN